MPSDLWQLEKEEERRRKEEAAKKAAAQAKATRDVYGNEIIMPVPNPAKRTAGAPVVQRASLPTPELGQKRKPADLGDLPSREYAQAKDKAAGIMEKRKGKGALEEFHMMRNEMGDEGLRKRFEDMTSLVETYLDPVSAAGAVWDLVRAPFTTDAAEYFLSRGSAALQDGTALVTDKTIRMLGLDKRDSKQVALAQAALTMGKSVGTMVTLPVTGSYRVAQGIVNMVQKGQAGTPWGDVAKEAGYGMVTEGAKTASTAMGGEIIEQGLLSWEERSAKTKQARLDKEQRAAEISTAAETTLLPVAYSPLLAEHQPGAKSLIAAVDGLRTFTFFAERSDLSSVLAEVQKDVFDADGNLIAEGQLKDMEPGNWTSDKRQDLFYVLAESIQDNRRAAVELQRQLKESSDVSWDAPLDSDLESLVWMEGLARYKSRMAKASEMWEQDAEFMYAFGEEGGLPTSWDEFARAWRATGENGWLQASISKLVKTAMVPGQAQQAILAGVNLTQRQNADPAFQKAMGDGRAYITSSRYKEERNEEPEPTDPSAPIQFGDPLAAIRSSDAGVQTILETEFADDPHAQELLKKIRQETYRLIDQPHIVSYIDVVGRSFGIDGQALEDFAHAQPDVVQAADVLTNIGVGIAMMKYPLTKVIFGRNTILPSGSVSRVMDDLNFRRVVKRIDREMQRGREGEAASVLGGSPEARALIREAQAVRGGGMTADTPEVRALADELALAAHAVAPEQIARRLAFKSEEEAATFLRDLWKGADKVDAEAGVRREKSVATLKKLGLTDEETLSVMEGRLTPEKAAEAAVLRRKPGTQKVFVDKELEPLPAKALWHTTVETAVPAPVAVGRSVVDIEVEMDVVRTQLGKTTRESYRKQHEKAEEGLAKAEEAQANAETDSAVDKADARVEKWQAKLEALEENLGLFDELDSLSNELTAVSAAAAVEAPAPKVKAKQQVVTIQAIRTVNGERELKVRTSRKGESGEIEEHWVKESELSERGGAVLDTRRRHWTPAKGERGTLELTTRTIPERETITVAKYGKVEPVAKRIAAAKKRADSTSRDYIAGRLAYRQRYRADVFGARDTRKFLMHRVAKAYANGADILPDFRVSDLSHITHLRRETLWVIQNMPDSPIRTFLAARMAGIGRKPLPLASHDLPDYVDAIGDSVLYFTNDVAQATKFKNLAMNIRTPQAAKRLGAEIDALAQKYRVMDQKARRGIMSKLREGKATDPNDIAYPTAMGVGPEKGDVLGVYDRPGPGGEKTTVQAVSNPSFQTLDVPLPDPGKLLRGQLRYLETPEDALLLSRALIGLTNTTRRVRNVGRRGAVVVTDFNNPMRNVSVGTGAIVLAQKHAFTDIGVRTGIEKTGAFRWRSHQRKFDKNLERMTAEGVDQVSMFKHLTELSEEHYLTERGEAVGWTRKLAFDAKGKPANLQEVAAAIRRQANEPIFRAYASGGRPGVAAWFASAEGTAFLRTSGLMTRMKEMLKENGGSTKNLRQVTIDDYVDKWVTALYEPWEVSFPQLYGRMAEVARAGRSFSTEDITTMLKDVNRGKPASQWENPYMSLPVTETGGFVGAFVNMTKLGMTPNRAARTITFKAIFNDTFERMVKEGVDPDKAGRASATAAYLKTSQIHFDLSHATAFEQKFRYLVWFGTKHRLWASWLVKTGWKSPALGAAVVDFSQWMVERNERAGVPEYYKYSVTLPWFGGGRIAADMKPYLWLTEYPAGSTTEAMIEQVGSWAVNAVAGPGTVTPSPNPFGYSIVRTEDIMREIVRTASSPWGKDPLGKGEPPTEEDVLKWLQKDGAFGFGKADAALFQKQIARTRQWAAVNGEEIDIVDAVGRTMLARLVSEGLKLLKPAATRIITSEELAVEKAKRAWEEEPTAAGRAKILNENPYLAYTWNLSADPFEKAAIDDGQRKYKDIEEEAAKRIQHLDELGQIMDTEKTGEIIEARRRAIIALEEENPTWAGFHNESGQKEVMDALGLGAILPLADEVAVGRNVEGYTTDQIADYEQERTNHFNQVLQEQGIVEQDMGEPYVKLLKKLLITDPIDRAQRNFSARGQEPSMNEEQKLVARYLARGKDGLLREDSYKRMIHDKEMEELWLSGLKGGKTNVSAPLFSSLTNDERELMGWSGDPTNVRVWADWGWKHLEMDRRIRLVDKTGSSSYAKKEKAAFAEWSETLALKNPSWGTEYKFAQLDTRARLVELGYGKSGKAAAGWQTFFTLVEDFENDLAATPNPSLRKMGVTAGAQAAAPMHEAYVQMLQATAATYPDWFDEFSRGFTPTAFGFHKAWMDGLTDDWWRAKAPYNEQPPEEITWE